MEKSDVAFDIPQDLICPIQREPMDMAVITQDGFTYDKSALEQWLTTSTLSPMLGIALESKTMRPNKMITFIKSSFNYYTARLAHFNSICKDRRPYETKTMPQTLKSVMDTLMVTYFRLASPLSELYLTLDKLLLEYPTAHQICYEYANMLRFGGNTERALEFIDKGEQLYPHSCVPHYMRIRVTCSKGKEYTGREMLEKTLRKVGIQDHSLIEIRYLSSAFLSTHNRYYSLQLISSYLLACPNDMRAMLNQVYVYYNMSDHENVLEMSRRFLERYEFDACVLYYRARAFGFKKNKEAAMNAFQQILNRCKEPIFLAQCLYDRALMRSIDTEYLEVEADLKQAHAYYSKLNADLQLADIYKNKQNYTEALVWVSIYGERINKETDIYYNRILAEIKDKMGLSEEAIQCYTHLGEIDPANGQYYTGRINILLDRPQNEA